MLTFKEVGMKALTLVGMLNDLNRRISGFDVSKLVTAIKNGDVEKERVQKLIDDVYNLEEDLIMIDCEKGKK